LRKARRANLPAEYAGPRGFQCWRAVLAAVVAPDPPWAVAHYCPRLRVTRPMGVDDVAGIAVLGLSVRVEDPLLDKRSALVCGLPRRTARVN
jgi:hypothetical protein